MLSSDSVQPSYNCLSPKMPSGSVADWSGGMPSFGGVSFRLCSAGGMPFLFFLWVGVLNSSGGGRAELANVGLSEKVE
eukprot:9753899-Heterocapsa_arctica.AAC.1